MSFLKDLGQFAGKVTGRVLGGSVRVVGEVTGSQYIKEVGNGVEKATVHTGRTVGDLASGVYDVAKGVITNDGATVDHGLNDIGGAVSDTAKGVVASAKYVYNNGKDVVTGIKDEDMDRVKHGAKGLVTAAAVSVIAVGILDVADGADGIGEIAAESDPSHAAPIEHTTATANVEQTGAASIENPNTHHVEPHYVEGYERADGTHVEGYYRDGDGDTSVNRPNGGYEQHNPDYKA
ncbi:hypothetical protein MKY59_05120 [Paenibacillus sp. FSL W8-0426]|uniref:hypothetical protein n=1 Tax=Paenibacillus sp. FSL W8-0426 TaxID=2921714 RepID=UPI0030DD8F73